MRKLISDFFVGNPKIEVVGTARNGKDAIKKIKPLKPNVVTMDVEMPEMNGLDALKQIMAEFVQFPSLCFQVQHKEVPKIH